MTHTDGEFEVGPAAAHASTIEGVPDHAADTVHRVESHVIVEQAEAVMVAQSVEVSSTTDPHHDEGSTATGHVEPSHDHTTDAAPDTPAEEPQHEEPPPDPPPEPHHDDAAAAPAHDDSTTTTDAEHTT